MGYMINSRTYQPDADLLRIPVNYQKYRYANISQKFYGFQKYRFVGDSAGFAPGMETIISGIASILRKTLELTSWYF